MNTSQPKLPVLWRAKSRTIEPVAPPDNLDHYFGELIQAHGRGMRVVFYPVSVMTPTGWSSSWSVNIFIDNRFWRNWPVPTGKMIGAIEWAERLCSYFPGSYVVDETRTSARVEINTLKGSDLVGRELHPRQFNVPGMVPSGVPTLLYGDGGTGKSFTALQLAFATASGLPWFGKPVTRGCCLFLTAEDEIDDVQERLEQIAASNGVELGDLSDLHIISLAGEEAVLGQLDLDSGTIQPTPLFEMLEARIAIDAPVLVVLDTLADLFAGDENVRSQARQFISLMRRLTKPCGSAILILAHPSVAGMASGFGTSGNTAWSNSVRSRLYLERVYVKGKDGTFIEPDENVRLLSNKKLNYGPSGTAIRLRWVSGLYQHDDQIAATTIPNQVTQNKADAKFLELLGAFAGEGRNVSVAGPTYAPTKFAKDDRREGIGRAVFAAAMNRLLAAKKIAVVPYGKPSRQTKRLEIVA